MINFHYTQNYLSSVQSHVDRAIRKVLNEYTNLKSLKGIGKVSSFNGGVFVLRIKSPYCEVILEEKKVEHLNNLLTVYFVRGFKAGLQDYVEIRDGKWLLYNPLSVSEVDSFLININLKNENEIIKNEPPADILAWQSEYKLNVKYDVYESDSWVKFAASNSSESGMKDDEAKLYRLVLLDIINQNPSLKINTIYSGNDVNISYAILNDIGIIYSFLRIDQESIFVLFNGANLKTQKEHWEDSLKIEYYLAFKLGTIKDVSSISLKAYPSWVINDADLWSRIEKNNEMGNLSLLPEQTDFLRNFRFPKYINGQAGSGKSTMLYYLFANAYYYKYAGLINGDIIFLTENENLLTHTKRSVYELLLFNPEFDLAAEDTAITNVDKHFFSLKQFLLNLLPETNHDFDSTKYLNFSRFKILYEKSNIANHVKNKYSAEIVWFTISTYVYGYDLNYQITSQNYNEKMPKDGKEIISLDILSGIEREIIKPFYEKLLINDGYWDKLKLIKYLQNNIEIQNKYDVIFCDEAQDFSRVELEFILKLSSYTNYNLSNVKQFPVVFAGDALQTVNPTGFRTEVLTSMIFNELTNEKIGFKLDASKLEFTPTFNYRSSQQIVNLANCIQYYRKNQLGAEVKSFQVSKRPVLNINEHLNVFIDFETFNSDLDLQEKLEYKTIIVPVNYHEIDDYKREFPVLNKYKNVISAVDSKGIDFSEVVIFGFGQYSFDNLNGVYEKRYFFNKLYVAVTRAQSELVIIDSKNSKDQFWKVIVNEFLSSEVNYNGLNLKSFDNIIILDANTVIQSTPNIVESDAYRLKERGVIERNVALLQVASSHFIKIDNKKEYYLCLGEIEEIKENWRRAAEYYSHLVVGNSGNEKAIMSFWKGKLWKEVIVLSKQTKSLEAEVMSLVSFINLDLDFSTDRIAYLVQRKDILRKVISFANWKNDFISLLIAELNNSKNYEFVILIADLLEYLSAKGDIVVWESLAAKYFELKRYDASVAAFEMIGDENSVSYLKAKLELAKRKNDIEEVIIFLGRLAIETNESKIDYAQQIIQYYTQDISVAEKIKNLYVIQYVYFAYLITVASESDIIKFAKDVESRFHTRKRELAESYFRLLKYKNISKASFLFILYRWVKLLHIDGESTIVINEMYESIGVDLKVPYAPFTNEEIENIDYYPTRFRPILSEHIKNVKISNFRGFNSLKIENLGLFNVIVGDNNIGKTSILEALLFTPIKRDYIIRLAVAYIERSNLFPEKVESSNKHEFFYRLNKDVISDYKNVLTQEDYWSFEIYDNRESLIFNVHTNENSKQTINSQELYFTKDDFDKLNGISLKDFVSVPFIPFGKGFSSDLAQCYHDSIVNNVDPNIEFEFMENLKLFIPGVNRISVDTRSGVINIRDNKSPHLLRPLFQYGEGANKLFRILLYLTINKGKRLMIDEIDSGIHYSRFKEFWSIILNIAYEQKTQIFATTHNDECIKYFSEILSNFGSKFQSESRVIQFKDLNGLKSRSFDFKSFNLAYLDDIEIRGGDEL